MYKKFILTKKLDKVMQFCCKYTEQQHRLEQQLSISQQRVDDWHKAQNIVSSQGVSSSRDMYQEVVNKIKQDYGVDSATAHQWADSNNSQAQVSWGKIQVEDKQRSGNYVQDLVNNIASGKAELSGVEATSKLDQFTNEHSSKINENPQERAKQYAQGKMNIDGFEERIQIEGNDLKRQHERVSQENSDQYYTEKKHNEGAEKIAEQGIKKYERDRMGQGVVGTVGGIGNNKKLIGNANNKLNDQE